ncbi:MAG: sugar phosphate isomerase/epimerase [Planctomycetota bacterium]|nr:MAG: sugar phosphate isomerase/epimerase [Planctomycetota bacterium]
MADPGLHAAQGVENRTLAGVGIAQQCHLVNARRRGNRFGPRHGRWAHANECGPADICGAEAGQLGSLRDFGGRPTGFAVPMSARGPPRCIELRLSLNLCPPSISARADGGKRPSPASETPAVRCDGRCLAWNGVFGLRQSPPVPLQIGDPRGLRRDAALSATKSKMVFSTDAGVGGDRLDGSGHLRFATAASHNPLCHPSRLAVTRIRIDCAESKESVMNAPRPVSTSCQSRRQMLMNCGAAAMAAVLGRPTLSDAADADPWGGFRMGIQSYSLRGFDTETALKHSQRLGLRYWEAYPKHIPQNALPGHVEKYKKLLAKYGVTLLAYGVIGFDANETRARAAFDFAKAMGIVSISANPQKNKATFDLLDKLVEEYGVAIAIHNHGPGALYDKISDVEQMVKDRHPLIGACVDTGHYLRSDEDPVEAIERFGPRVHGVHLKDVKTVQRNGRRRKLFKILGEGDLDIVGCLRALRRLEYRKCLSLEYEENPKNPLSDIAVCLQAVRAAVRKLSG